MEMNLLKKIKQWFTPKIFAKNINNSVVNIKGNNNNVHVENINDSKVEIR